MLDVHPPHQPTHTWRDFFIHIATICVGLLIAVGLEQTVEAIHRHGERRELLAQLATEHRRVLRDAEESAKDAELLLNHYADDITALQAVAQHQPYLPPPPPPPPKGNIPEGSVWSAAKAAGRTSLLPQDTIIVNSEAENLLSTI